MRGGRGGERRNKTLLTGGKGSVDPKQFFEEEEEGVGGGSVNSLVNDRQAISIGQQRTMKFGLQLLSISPLHATHPRAIQQQSCCRYLRRRPVDHRKCGAHTLIEHVQRRSHGTQLTRSTFRAFFHLTSSTPSPPPHRSPASLTSSPPLAPLAPP